MFPFLRMLSRRVFHHLRLCSRYITSFSGRLDGTSDGMAPSNQHFEEIKPDAEKLLKNEMFLVTAGNENGFMINMQFVVGPVLILPYMGYLHWRFNDVTSANPDSLFLISRIFPKVW